MKGVATALVGAGALTLLVLGTPLEAITVAVLTVATAELEVGR